MNIEEQLESLQNTKTNIRNAIIEDGVAVPQNTPFSGYANLIRKIKNLVLIEKTITKNGIYLPADDEADGYKKIIVDVKGVPVTREKVTRECDDWHTVSHAVRENVTRSITDDSVCWQGILNSHLTQTGGSMTFDMVYTGGDGYSISSDIVLPLNTADSWEFGTKYTHNGGGNVPTILGSVGANYLAPHFRVAGGYFAPFISSNGTNWNINNGNTNKSTLRPTQGETYYLKMGFDGSEYYIDYNTTGWNNNFTRIFSLQNSTQCYCAKEFALMNSPDQSNYYNNGSMDLLETYWKINGAEYLRCATKQFY